MNTKLMQLIESSYFSEIVTIGSSRVADTIQKYQRSSLVKKTQRHDVYWCPIVDGGNPAPVDRQFIPLITGFYTSQVVQDFFHQQYALPLWNGDLWSVILNENGVPGFGEPVATEDPEGYYHLSFGGEKTHPKQKTRHVLLWYIYIYNEYEYIYIWIHIYIWEITCIFRCCHSLIHDIALLPIDSEPV